MPTFANPALAASSILTGGKYAGLSSYLAGVSSLDLVSIRIPRFPISSHSHGTSSPESSGLALFSQTRRGHRRAAHKFKFIVIDSPPIMAATDAVILSVQADGVLLVVRARNTQGSVHATRDLLNSVKCRILGVVLNAVDASAPTTTTLTLLSVLVWLWTPGSGRKLRYEHKEDEPSSSASPAIATTMTPRPFKEALCAILITGGAGFIGSHLAERLLDRGDRVVLLDNLSTGSVENIRHLKSSDRMQYHLDNIENRQLLAELVDDADVIVHLAAAVGVSSSSKARQDHRDQRQRHANSSSKLLARKKKLVLTASTSEVYGKNTNVPFHEDATLSSPHHQRPLELRRLQGPR